MRIVLLMTALTSLSSIKAKVGGYQPMNDCQIKTVNI